MKVRIWKKWRKKIEKYLIPSKRNRYKPHLLRRRGAYAACVAVALLFLISVVQLSFITRNIEFIAAVLPAVLVDLTNENRYTFNLPRLAVNQDLTVAAQMKAADMAARGYFSHNNPDGLTPWHWLNKAGYDFEYAGENLALHFSDSVDVEQAWMNSPTHRENILNGNFTEIGIATAQGTYEGETTIFVVQMFGRPVRTSQASAAGITPVASPEPAQSSGGAVGDVAGASSAAPVRQKAPAIVEVLEETDTYIAVARAEEDVVVAGAATLAQDAQGAQAGGALQRESSIFERFITQPSSTTRTIYTALAVLVALVLILTIVVEIRVQHPSAMFYGTFLITVLVLAIYLNQYVISGKVLVQ